LRRRIIIEVRSNSILDRTALLRVAQVMDQGRISKAGTGEHYCWHTEFADGIVVSVRRKRRNSSADSFVVYREAFREWSEKYGGKIEAVIEKEAGDEKESCTLRRGGNENSGIYYGVELAA